MIAALLGFVHRGLAIAVEERVPPWQQLKDFRFFHRTTRMSPAEFHRYGLWDRRRPLRERLAYLSHEEHRLIERRVNPKAAVQALNDKISAATRLAAAGIPMPTMLGVIEPAQAVGGQPQVSGIASALQMLIGSGIPGGFVIKPNRGQGGHDVQVFLSANAEELTRANGERVTVEGFATELAAKPDTRWKVEARLEPHPDIARFTSRAIASMRVLTFRSPTGEVHVGPASLKLPMTDSGVDNFGAGNLAAPVDLATGRLGTAVRAYQPGRFTIHPPSQLRIDGFIVPDVPAVIALVTAAAQALNDLTILGWDVALTPSRPVILEGNAWWSELILQKPQEQGIVTGRFAELLEEHGLAEILEVRRKSEIGD